MMKRRQPTVGEEGRPRLARRRGGSAVERAREEGIALGYGRRRRRHVERCTAAMMQRREWWSVREVGHGGHGKVTRAGAHERVHLARVAHGRELPREPSQPMCLELLLLVRGSVPVEALRVVVVGTHRALMLLLVVVRVRSSRSIRARSSKRVGSRVAVSTNDARRGRCTKAAVPGPCTPPVLRGLVRRCPPLASLPPSRTPAGRRQGRRQGRIRGISRISQHMQVYIRTHTRNSRSTTLSR